jgi:uncharacterized protein (DUF433 family)
MAFAPRRSGKKLGANLPLRLPRGNVPDMSDGLITTSSDIMGGTPVFAGTRVPVQFLIEFLEAGDSIDAFLTAFPSVTRAQVVALLEKAAGLAVTAAA